ncbi:hypothetical protein H2199_004023 [Coniosporium tulheliwenetii]|uniref:Uncharacterized protein n=1 Tax=Coniosporium tulheliwenetii TaxID=3383036 RepID=A0ACC2Z9X6_9PEZI|nr:hypothetical protein H2199_004023 [Cladosporium sp. JES 115]
MSLCTEENSGKPIPDSANFNLPLENYRQDMCWDFCVGDQAACTTKSRVCYNFEGYNLIFDYQAVPGYTYTDADIWLGLSAPAAGSTPTPQYTSSSGHCTVATDGSSVHCIIPYRQITSSQDVLGGMCPYGDREGLIFYLHTNAQLKHAAGTVAQGTKYCSFGTAFGYSPANPKSLTLNSYTPRPNTCNRWGWYTAATTAQLGSGIGGPLYVGAGRNDISKATDVGIWSATLSGGNVFVTYSLSGAYSLAEIHVDIGCLPFATCAPGQYKYVNDALATSPAVTSFTTPGLKLPSCSAGQLYLIVHASVDTSYNCS